MKRKCIFILCFILLLFLFFNISESKASFEVEYNGNIVSLPDIDFKHYVVFSGHNTYYLMVLDDAYIENGYVCKGNANSFGYCKDVKTWTDNKKILFAYYSLNDDEWKLESEGTGWTIGQLSIVYSTEDIYYNDKLIFEASFRADMNYIEEDNIYQACTNFFDMSEFDNLACYISSDNSTWDNMLYEEDTINNQFLFYYNITKNDTYYIKLVYLDTLEEIVVTVTADKIEEQDISLNLHLSTTEQTTEPIYILSNKYYYEGTYDATEDFLNNYDIDIAYGLESPYQFSPFSINGTDENGTFCQYQYKIVANGVYQARIVDLISGEISYQSFNVNNIGVKNKWGDDVYYNNYNENGEFEPTPILFLEYVNTTTVRIRTQPFIFNELIYLECYFSSDGENYEKIENIYKYSIDTGNSSYDYNTGEKQNIQDLYYFYYDVNIDGTYYFKFYNIDLDKYTSSSIDVNIREFISSNIYNISDFGTRIEIWVKEHFGVLIFPFEFIFKLCDRILKIEEAEPILHIPELKDPFFNYKILDATDFNFNSILENNFVKTIYNIYLVAVDCIFIFVFLIFCKRTFEEVFPGD